MGITLEAKTADQVANYYPENGPLRSFNKLSTATSSFRTPVKSHPRLASVTSADGSVLWRFAMKMDVGSMSSITVSQYGNEVRKIAGGRRHHSVEQATPLQKPHKLKVCYALQDTEDSRFFHRAAYLECP